MVNKQKNRKGFTLPELLVAMTVLVLVIFAATNLLVTVIRSNNENLNTMIAYGLAQEGLEGVRNIRDSNWLLGASFEGRLKTVPVWGEILNTTQMESLYIIDLNAFEKAPGQVSTPQALAPYTPWTLTKVDENALEEKSVIKKFAVQNQYGGFRYGHSNGSTDGEDTPFRRYLSIRKIPTEYEKPGEMKKIRVASIVEWTEGARLKTVRLDTELTDWYEGN